MTVAKRLLLQYANETGKSWRHDLPGFINWFHGKTDGWEKSTYRQYKASLIYYLKIFGNTDSIYALEQMTKKRKSEIYSGKKKTSQQKEKRLKRDDLVKILNSLKTSWSGYRVILSNWLFSGEVTGLRPIEWHESRFVRNENGVFLIVSNAKNSNMRANGDFRTIVLTELDFNSQSIIQSLSETLSVLNEKEFELMYKNCSDLLYRTARKLFPRRKVFPTLYSARHQFSANAKGSGLTLQEIAALMGHATDETATRHYGKKRNFKSKIAVKPLSAEVKSVRKKHKKRGLKNEIDFKENGV